MIFWIIAMKCLWSCMTKMIIVMNSIDHVIMAVIFMSSWKLSWPLENMKKTQQGNLLILRLGVPLPTTSMDLTRQLGSADTALIPVLEFELFCKYIDLLVMPSYILHVYIEAKIEIILFIFCPTAHILQSFIKKIFRVWLSASQTVFRSFLVVPIGMNMVITPWSKGNTQAMLCVGYPPQLQPSPEPSFVSSRLPNVFVFKSLLSCLITMLFQQVVYYITWCCSSRTAHRWHFTARHKRLYTTQLSEDT